MMLQWYIVIVLKCLLLPLLLLFFTLLFSLLLFLFTKTFYESRHYLSKTWKIQLSLSSAEPRLLALENSLSLFVMVCHCLSLFELIFCRAKIVVLGEFFVIVYSLVMLSFQMSVINISCGWIVRKKQHVEDLLIASMYSL